MTSKDIPEGFTELKPPPDATKDAAVVPHPLDVLDDHLAEAIQSASKRKAIIAAFKDAIAAAVATYQQDRSKK